MKHIEAFENENDLTEQVRTWINERVSDYGCDNVSEVIEELLDHGCQSGVVSGMIYYTDTLAFFEKHVDDINSLLKELLFSTGCSINELFGDKWDNDDPLIKEQQNQNLLAWFGFEETARQIGQEIGLEL